MVASLFAVELRLDANFDIRLRAAHRFLSAIEGRRLSTPPLALPRQRRQHFILTIRALDAWLQDIVIVKLPKACSARSRLWVAPGERMICVAELSAWSRTASP